MDRNEVFYDLQEALDCQAQHPEADITFQEGCPIMVCGEPIYCIPEERPSWTVWWVEEDKHE